MADEYVPLRSPGKAITAQASAPVLAGQLVEITGDNTVGPAAAASAKWRGVAAFNAAAGDLVTVLSGGDQELIATGMIAAGAPVAAAANGAVAAAGADDPVVGVAFRAASGGRVHAALVR
ncbi:MAG: capsid cement protein [Dietzia sp.]